MFTGNKNVNSTSTKKVNTRRCKSDEYRTDNNNVCNRKVINDLKLTFFVSLIHYNDNNYNHYYYMLLIMTHKVVYTCTNYRCLIRYRRTIIYIYIIIIKSVCGQIK